MDLESMIQCELSRSNPFINVSFEHFQWSKLQSVFPKTHFFKVGANHNFKTTESILLKFLPLLANIIDEVTLESFFQICLNFYFLNNKLADFFPQKSRFSLQSVPKNLKIETSINPPSVTWEKCLSNERTLIF